MANNVLPSEYSHKSLNEIRADLKECLEVIGKNLSESNKYIKDVDSFWKTLSYDDFVSSAYRCKKLLSTAKEDITYILSELNAEVKENHINLLRRIGVTGMEFNKEIGLSKGQGGRRLEDGSEYQLYCLLRDSMVYLMDLSDVANRLQDFVGKKKRHIPWGTIISNIIATGALIVSILAYIKE